VKQDATGLSTSCQTTDTGTKLIVPDVLQMPTQTPTKTNLQQESKLKILKATVRKRLEVEKLKQDGK
jgi:hypothetical protein